MSKQQTTSKLRSTLSKQHSILLPQTATMSNEYRKISFFRQSRMLLRYYCRFWQQCCRFRQQCRTKFCPLDKVERKLNIVAKNGNNVEATCDIVERIVKLVAFDDSTMLFRHCCWYGHGLTGVWGGNKFAIKGNPNARALSPSSTKSIKTTTVQVS